MREVDPKHTKRARAFDLWMQAPMPMVTLFYTLEVSNLRWASRKHGYPFNMLLCWCIGRAAARMEEFYLLPVGNKLIQYDKLAVNAMVAARDGDIYTCDLAFDPSLPGFAREYATRTQQVAETCQPYALGEDYMVIGTSALAQWEIDGAVNLYAGIYNNPFLIWGKYRKTWLKTKLPVSFQFHHTQLDGAQAAGFLQRLQEEIRSLR